MQQQLQQKKENKYVWRGKHFHFIYTTRTHTPIHNARHIEEKVLDFVALRHVFREVRPWLNPLFIVTFCLRFYLTYPSLFITITGYLRPNLEYTVWYRLTDAQEWRTMRIVQKHVMEATIPHLLPGREYEFMVLSQDKYGDGMFSKPFRYPTQRKFIAKITTSM